MLAEIRKEKGEWFVYSEDGKKRLGGPYKTKDEAEERLRQIEHFKNAEACAPRRARYLSTGFLALAPRAFGQEYDVKIAGPAPDDPPPFDQVGEVAILRINGPLEQHPGFFWQDYETIHACASAAFKSGARAVALCINSPGGSAAGCFELARALRAMSLENEKPLGVFVDGMACSAAYALACSATAGIHAPPTSTVASLAVYEMIVDQTGLDEQLGLRFTFVPSSGADLKLTGNAHATPTDAQIEHTQGQVDLLTDYFYELVESMRGVPQAAIRALRGASLLASQGVDKGLVDALNDWNGFLAHLQAATIEGTTMPTQAKKAENDGGEKSPLESALASLMEAAGSDDEETSKSAKKLLAVHFGDGADESKKDGDKEPDGDEAKKAKADAADGDPKKDEDEKARKAKAEEDEAKKAKAEGEEEPKKAQAHAAAAAGSASNEVALANRVLALEAKLAAEAEATTRAELLAKRPDFSAEVKKAYAKLPIDALRVVVETAPRVAASPGAAAAAATPGATPGATDGVQQGVRPEQQQLLDRLDRQGPRAQKAHSEGSSFYLDFMTPEAAAKRAAEMREQGLSPEGASQGAPRIPTRGFQTAK